MASEHYNLADSMKVMVSGLKHNVQRIKPQSVEAFIQSQKDVTGPVSIVSTREAGAEAGASNGLLIFTAKFGSGPEATTRELVLRYQPLNEIRTFRDTNFGAQFDIQLALQQTDVPTPKPLWVDRTGEVLGTPGYIMEYAKGEVPSGSLFSSGILADASPEKRKAMLFDILSNLAKLHKVDWRGLGLREDGMPAAGSGASPLERYINYYWDLWSWVDSADRDDLLPYRDWLLANQPEIENPVLMHGDPSCHNYLFHQGKVSSVLDFELAAIGAPELDLILQFYLIDMFSKTMGGVPGVPSEDEYRQEYERLSGRKLNHREYFQTLGTYIPVIIVKSQGRQLEGKAAEANKGAFGMFWQMLETRRTAHGF